METDDESGSWSIGQLADATGLTVKTVRFYSDAGLLPAARTRAGHRRYSPDDLVRLQLIRGLRELDVDLPTIATLLAEARDLSDLLAGYTRVLRLRQDAIGRQLVVSRAAASSSAHVLARFAKLSEVEAAERARLLSHFWTDARTDARTDTT